MHRLYRVSNKLLVLSALFLALAASFQVSAQTTVTPAPGPGYTLCVGGNYTPIGTIVIRENIVNSYPVTGGLTYFRLRLPAGFSFNSSATLTISAPGLDDFFPNPAFAGYFNSNTEIEISYRVTGSSNDDFISIAGLEVHATAVGSGNIVRVTSTAPGANQPGNNIANNISHGTLTSTNFGVTLSSSDPDNQICAGQLVTITATPNNSSSTNTYEFFRNGASVQGPGTIAQYTAALNDNDEITVTAATPDGCSSTITPGNGITTDVLALPVVNAPAGPFTICGNGFADLAGTTFSNSPGIVWASSGDGSFQPNALTANAKYYPGSNDIINGSATLTITTTGSPCTAVSDNVNVTINPLPVPVISGLNAVCENQAGVVYSSPNVVGHTYVWAITGGTITAGAGTSSITVTWGTAGAGTLQLTQTITATTCAVTTPLYNITKNANPTPVISGPATVCASHAGDVYSTTNVVGNSYSWTVSGGTITAGAGTNSITVTWGSGASGTVQLTETVTATGCATATANYNVTINPLPVPVISGLNAVCENQAGVVYSSPNVVGHTYVWAITGGTITAGAGTSSITVTWGTAGAGTLQLTQTITATTCAVTTPLYNITKNANPTPVISGPATVCASHAGDVYSTTNVVGNSYSWTVSGGTITAGAGTNSITVTWGSGASGTVQLTETVTATGCATATANYNVTINPLPVPVISGLNAVCENQAGVVYSSPNVVGHTYVWAITGGTITAGAGTSSITVTWGTAGAGTLQLTQTITATTCAVTTPLYNITKNANPTPVISGPATVCASHAGDVYSTTNVVGNSYSWTVSGGTITAGAGTNSITVTWGSGASGTVQLTETVTATGCATATANYNVTINPLPVPVISGLNAVCENQAGVVYSSPNVVGHTYVWAITGGTITAGAGTSSITVTWGTAGAGTLQLTQTITATTCAVTTPLYNITKNANPTPVISGPATVCASHAGDVYSTTNVVGNSYSWTVSGGTITAGAGTNSITVTWGSGASGTVQLTETVTATGCATATANYNVTINPLPVPVISGLNAVCENQAGVVYSSPNVVGHTYVWAITGGTITAGAGTSSITVTWGTAGAGTLQLTQTITATTCAVTTPLYNITKNANPTPVISGPATVCASHAGDVYSTTNVVGNSYSWTVSGGTITAGAGTNSITVTWGSGASGTVQLTETVTATGCATATANYNVTINPLPVPVISGLNAVCENQAGVVYSSPNVVGHTYVWAITGGTITAGAGTSSITVTWGTAGAGTLQLTQTITATTCAVTTPLYNITKNANPTPVISGPATVCASHAGDVYSTTNVVGNSYSWTVSGGTITAGAGTNSITVTWGSGASGTVQLTETVTATGCATATANYNVTINPLPVPVISGLNAVCENQAGVVYSSPNVVGHTYVWAITGGTITAGAGTSSITVTWGTAGAGTLQLTQTITATTCAVTTPLYNITKNANPTPVISGPATVCASHAGDVYSTTNVVGNSYSWTVSGGTITAGAGTNSITVTWGSGASGTVQLTETVTATGCATATANYNVTINPLPVPVISGLNAVCENQAGVVYSSPNVVGHTYVWAITGGTITAGAGTSSITVTWGTAGAGTLQLTQTITATTCAVTTPLYNITKNANPTPVISGPATVCASHAGDVYSSTNVVGNSYSWTVSGGTITAGAGTNSITVTWGSGASGTVQLTETVTATGCATATANYNVTINPLPVPVISGLNAVCENQAGVVYSSPNVVGHTYVWAITGGTITAGAGTSSITVTWGTAGAGTLQLTQTITATTCAVTTPLYNITKNANPTPVISGPATVCASHAGDVYSSTNVVGNSYSWTVSGGTITAGAGTNSITVTWGSGASGTVQLTETVTATGCATATANYNVTINPLPVPVISGLNAVCENQAGVVYSSPNVVGHTYVWAITGGTITAGAGTSSITVTWGTAGAGTLQLTQTITATTCAVTTPLYNITKNANPTPVISGPATVCASHAGDVYSTTNVVGNSYSWTVSGGTITAGAGTNSITVTWGSGASGTVQLTETVTATGCATATANYNVTINPLPVPVISGLNAVCENQAGVVYSSPNVVGHTYVWAITGGTITAGAGTSSITVTWGTAGAGTLQLTQTITATTCAVTTPLYNITKNANPTPVISGPATVCASHAGDVYSTTNVVGNSYSWTVSGGTITAGAGTNSITVTWGSGASGTVQLTETVTATGCATATANYNVTINPLPVPVISGLNAVCENQAGVVYSSPNVVGHTYVWAITGGTITAGAGTSSITVTWGTAGAGTLQLTQTITATTCAVTTPLYNITKNANPTPVISGPATVCASHAGDVYSTTNVVGNSYSWTVSGGTITAGAGTNSITVTWGSGASGTVQLTETVTATGCATATANYNVTINPLPVVTGIPDQVVCNGVLVPAITLSASTGGGETFTWTGGASVGLPDGSDNSAPFDIPAFTGNNVGNSPVTVPVSISASKAGCLGPVQNFNITVNPIPTFGITNLTPSICEGTAANITLTSPTTNAIITLVGVVYGGATGGSYSGGEIFTTGQKINETLINPTESPVTVTYTFAVSANGCTDPVPQSTQIIINPAPPVFSIANSTAVICTGAVTSITLNTPTLNALVRLDAVTYGTATGSALVIGSTYTDGQVITQTLTNATNAPTTVTYTFSVSANGCNNPVQQQTTVVVNPSPTMSINTPVTSICSGSPIGVTLNSPTSGATIRLVSVNYNGVTGTLTAPVNYAPGSVITESLINPTDNPITVTYNFDVSANGCSTAGPFSTNIQVKPNPVFSITNAATQVCEGTPTDITLNTPTFSGQVRLDAVNYNGATGSGAYPIGHIFTDGQKLTEVLVNPTNFPITVTYTFSASATGCGNPVQQQTTVSITRNALANAGADYTVCEPASILVTGSISGSATSGLWTIVSGNGTLSATNVAYPNVSVNYNVVPADVGGTIILRLTSNDPDGPGGPCIGNSDDVQITINRAASITAGIDLAQCRDQASIALQGVVTYAPTGVSWSGGTGSFGAISNPTSTYSFNNPSEINTNITLTLTANDPDGGGPTGPCGIVTDQMVLRINQLPTVVFTGFGPGAPPQVAENASPIELTGNQSGGTFTILPATSSIGSTTNTPVDKVSFDPSAVDLGANFITYTYTDANSCTNSQTQQIIVNPVTNIDFTLQYWNGSGGPFVPPNGTGGYDFCANVGLVRIVGDPVVSSGINPTNFVAVGANSAILNAKISQVGSDYFIDTDGLASNDYLLQYTYTNSLGVTSAPLIRPLKIFASPVAVIDNLLNNCISSGIAFTDASTISQVPFPASITDWAWDFGDGTTKNVANPPAYTYSSAGLYTVSLTVTTDQQCSNSTTLNIRVGDVPTVDFAWSAICTNDFTNFRDATQKLFPADPSAISYALSYTWDFGDGEVITGSPNDPVSLPETTGTYQNPEHKYATAGSKNVTLSIATNDGCNNSKLKTISILVSGSTVTPDELNPYSNNFEVLPDTEWVSEGFEISTNPDVFSNVSWQVGIPTGATINASATGTTSAWWTGANTNSYWPAEESAMNGPCFDLRSLKRPMVSLDYWSDAEQNLDGAALQYSTDGGLNWNLVGPLASSPNEGIEWYKGQTVQSNPGRQLFGSNGWTGKLTGWKNGRFNLDMIPVVDRDQVRLRVAFSSNNTNDPNKTFDGFAFDNVFIGERKRNVMVEYFTNAGINPTTNTYFDDLYAAQFVGPLAKDSSDFFKIQYHINSPSEDPINQDNPTDPAARALLYGVGLPPSGIMDGILGNYYGTTFNGNPLLITEEELERRSLEDPLFDIRIDTLAATSSSIKFHIEFTYKHPTLAFSTPVTLQAVLLQDRVGTAQHRNIVRKFLLGSEGITLNTPWITNQTESIDGDVEINAPIGQDNDSLYIVAFIQDKRIDSKVIHQALRIKLHRKSQAVITGIDNPVFEQVKNIAVYPNPATRYINFATETPLTRDYQYAIIDQRGITVLSGNLNRDLTIPQQVELSNIADGVYIVMITQNGRRLVQRKLAVLKR